jgi:hypothetical protein
MDRIEIAQCVRELNDRQTRLAQLSTVSSDDRPPTDGDLLGNIPICFPYDLVFLDLLKAQLFLEEFFKIVFLYKSSDHRVAVKEVFGLLRGKHENNLLLLIVAETMLSFFVMDRIRESLKEPSGSLAFLQNCYGFLSSQLSKLTLSVRHLQVIEVQKSDEPIPIDHPDYDGDKESVIPGLRQVVLEFRKLTTQISVSTMSQILITSNELLEAALTAEGAIIGADESFQYILVTLADAKFYEMRTILNIFNGFVLGDLRSSRLNFLIERVRIAIQFLETQKIRVPPLVLLPFITRNIPNMVLSSRTPIEIRGFSLWAVPTFVKTTQPAEIACTGDPCDVAAVYGYTEIDYSRLASDVQAAPTIQGMVIYRPVKLLESQGLIRVPEGDFVKALPDIGIFSNLLLMKLPGVNGRRSMADLPVFLRQFSEVWPKIATRHAADRVLAVITEIQASLTGSLLPEGYQMTGIVDPLLIEAIRTAIPAFIGNPVYIDFRILNYLRTMKK